MCTLVPEHPFVKSANFSNKTENCGIVKTYVLENASQILCSCLQIIYISHNIIYI